MTGERLLELRAQYHGTCTGMVSECVAEIDLLRLALSARDERVKELESLLASHEAVLKAITPCRYCGAGHCGHLWPSQRKCCPDCSHQPLTGNGGEGGGT